MGSLAGEPWTRREFLATTAIAAGALALLAACGPQALPKPSPVAPTRRFRSRPDLQPPTVEVTTQSDAVSPGYIFVAANGLLVLDNAGEPVWYLPNSGANGATNLGVQSYQGRLMLTWWEGQVAGTYGSGRFVIADRSYTRTHTVQAGNGYAGDLHEFLLTPDGTALIMAYSPRDLDLSPVGGAKTGQAIDCIVQEVDVASGAVRFEWHAIGHVDLLESQVTPTAGKAFDYAHLNSIDVDGDGNLLVSGRNTWAVYKVQRDSGAVLWRLGGKRSDFQMEKGATFEWQHDVRSHADGSITIYDDAAQPQKESQSRGMVLAVNEDDRTASLLRQYQHPAKLLSGSQGNMQILPNGNVFVGYGDHPNFAEFSSDGRLLYDAHFAGAIQSYRALRFPWVGRPVEAPAIAAERAANGQPVVYASWNGATEVHSWQLMGGGDAQSLQPVVTTPRGGFETVITAASKATHVAVRALDVSGSTLGISPTISV